MIETYLCSILLSYGSSRDAAGGRIAVEVVNEEIERLRKAWSKTAASSDRENLLRGAIGSEAVHRLDLFERMQLASVIEIASTSRSLSEAGRTLFANSREKKSSSNDADRLRKYLSRFGVTWDLVRQRKGSECVNRPESA